MKETGRERRARELRQMLAMRETEGLSVREIADRIGCSTVHVYNLVGGSPGRAGKMTAAQLDEIAKRYPNTGPVSHDEIGRRLGISRARVQQIEAATAARFRCRAIESGWTA